MKMLVPAKRLVDYNVKLHDAYVVAEFVGLIPVQSFRLPNSLERRPDGYVNL
jgi:hypothetical protein